MRDLQGLFTAGGIMGLRVAKNSLGNVPQRMFNGSSTLNPK
jgi:hypothetical protein